MFVSPPLPLGQLLRYAHKRIASIMNVDIEGKTCN